MSIKTYKPTTPSRRHMSVSGFDGVDKHAKPQKELVEVLKKHSGRNSYGRITVRHQGAWSTIRTAALISPWSSTPTASAATFWPLSA